MREHLKPGNSEQLASQPESREHEQKAEAHHRAGAETPNDQNIESIASTAKHEAKSSQEITVKLSSKENSKQHYYVNADLKAEAFQRALNRTRRQLSRPERGLSKVIHQPVVDELSKVAEVTVARPKSLLIGATVAVVGSGYLLYSAKHYGYTYNYLAMVMLFGGGYLVGVAIEFALHMLRRKNSR